MILHAAVSITVMLLVFVFSPKAFAGDTDSARNYLSTIVSCLSTIFALSISIPLVAIQLASSRYTHRVLDLFLKFPFNVSLILFFLVTIIQSLFLMSRIAEPIHQTLPSYLQPQMSADMVLVVLCFGILIVYIYAILQLLKPERIVAAIEGEFQTAIHKGQQREALTKVEQICDIAKRAAVDMDSTTGMMALTALQRIVDEGTAQTRASVTSQFIEIATIAAKEREAGMLSAVLQNLARIGEDAMTAGHVQDAGDVVQALARMVKTGLIGQQLLHFVAETVDLMYGLAGKAIGARVRWMTADSERFAEDTFAAICVIGEELLIREAAASGYVAGCILGRNFGCLLRRHTESARDRLTDGIWRLLYDYLYLAKILIGRVELRDIPVLTAWLLTESRDAKASPALCKTVSTVVLLLGALAEYAGRRDVLHLVMREMADGDPIPDDVRTEVRAKSQFLRPLFDFKDPVEYVQRAEQVWLCTPD